jgi:L-iditol 2-dehydrogenase
MKAVFLTKERKIIIEDILKPEIKNKTDVLVGIKSVGICGSDIHYYLEGKIGEQIIEDKIILGHEAAGLVVEVGKGVTNLKKGDKVAIEPGISCGKCEQCVIGKPNLCPYVIFFGTPPVDGALKEFVVMPHTHLIPLPDGLDYDCGVLSEPLAIGLYGVKLSSLSVGEDVAIIGAGPIGLSALFSAKLAGAKRIFVSDLYQARLDMAKKLGADVTVLATKENIVDVVMKETSGRGVDIGYEAAGEQETFNQATQVVKIGGKSVIFGIPAQDKIEFRASVVRRKELQILNVRRSAHTTKLALDLIKKNNVFSKLVTHIYELNDVEEAIKLVAEYKSGVIKAVVRM